MALKKTLLFLSIGALGGGLFYASHAEDTQGDSKESPVVEKVLEKTEEGLSGKSDKAPSSKRATSSAPSPSFASSMVVQPSQVVLPDFTSVVKKVMNSVVSITADQEQPERKNELDQFSQQFKGTPFEDFFKNFMGRENTPRRIHVGGSGFFIQIDKDCAYVVTNSHVVENAVRAKVIFDDKTEVPAVVHGSDPRTDLAVLRIELKDIPEDKRAILRPLQWGNSSKMEIGQWVLAFGNPFGLGNTVTAGIISAKGRNINTGGNTLTDDYIQHSAQINMGNSGGCLVNTDGVVIGINTVIITPSGGNVGIGLAITSANARKTIEQLILHKKVHHGALGVSVQDFTKEGAEALDLAGYKTGAIVNQVTPEGPAAKAGIKKGDIIVKFDEEVILDRVRLSRLVSEASVNTTHTVTVIRHGKPLTIKVSLGDFDAINNKGKKKPGEKAETKKRFEILGMTLMDPEESSEPVKNEDERLDQGAYVVKVKPDSAADDVGLVRGDLIVTVNQKPIKTAKEFYDAVVTAAKAGKRFLLLSARNGGIDRFLSLRLDEDEELKKLADEKTEAKGESQQKTKKSTNDVAKEAPKAEVAPETATKQPLPPEEPVAPDQSEVEERKAASSAAESEKAVESGEAPAKEEVTSEKDSSEPTPQKGFWTSIKGWFSRLFK